MKAVVDTNVVAYLLLDSKPYAEEARSFMATLTEGCAPAVWEAELANALWMATRHKVLTIEEAITRLTLANQLGIRSVANQILWQGALMRAHHSGVAVYDTLFVELASREGAKLATFNAAVLKAFPRIAARPSRLLGTTKKD